MFRGLEGVSRSPLEFSTIGRRRAEESGLIIHRVGHLARDEIEVYRSLRLTSVARTLVDLCAVSDLESIELALESALRQRVVTFDQIRDVLDRSGRTHKGRGTMRALLESHSGRALESSLEVRVWRLLRTSDLPAPVRQHEVRTPSGRFVARVDFAYREHRLAIEVDGFRFHSGRKDWSRERIRQNELLRLGWAIYRITWEDAVSAPQRVINDISQLLIERSTGAEWLKLDPKHARSTRNRV